MKIYQRLSGLVGAMDNCDRKVDTVKAEYVDHWKEQAGRHCGNMNTLVEDTAPSGSGIDGGVQMDDVSSHDNMLVFHFGYHHMNETGHYVGWSHHRLMVTPDMVNGIDLDFMCTLDYKDEHEDHGELYDALHDTFYDWLTTDEPRIEIPVETSILQNDLGKCLRPE